MRITTAKLIYNGLPIEIDSTEFDSSNMSECEVKLTCYEYFFERIKITYDEQTITKRNKRLS